MPARNLAPQPLPGTIPMLMSIALNKLRAWRAYRETVFQLESLADRELSDLGIGRRDIKRLAREANDAARPGTRNHEGQVGVRPNAAHLARSAG
jgi:uncharacterized protein YjiS (DUF1127 family)